MRYSENFQGLFSCQTQESRNREIGCNGTKRGYSLMSRKFLTLKDEYAVSRTVKAFEALTVLQTQALNICVHHH